MREPLRQRRHPRRSIAHYKRGRVRLDVPAAPQPPRDTSSHRRVMMQQIRNLVEAPMPCGLRPVFSPN